MVGLGLMAPLLLLVTTTFAVPICLFLFRSVDNWEIPTLLPRTVAALASWDGTAPPGEETYAALAADLRAARENHREAILARRLNYHEPGFRTLVMNTARAVESAAPASGSLKEFLIGVDPRWRETDWWRTIRQESSRLTPFYLLTAVDLRRDADGGLAAVPADRAIYLGLFGRTFWISLNVTLLCIALGFPVAHFLASAPPRIANRLMMLVLVPFWTSVLVRTTAWLVLLQDQGLLNDLLRWLNIVEQPLQLVFNRTGVYVAMTHVLLPFMILPLYSVMRGIPGTYMRAAASLGAPPWLAFRRVYLPLALPGVVAGALLVFILALGYYITPAIMGGQNDQMVSFFIAFYTNLSVNWGLAAALGTVLLAATLVAYVIYDRAVGIEKMGLS